MAHGVDFNAQIGQLLFGLGGEVFGVGCEHARTCIKNQHAALGRVDVPEVMAHVVLRDVDDGSGELDAGGAAADDDKVERGMPAVLLHLAFGKFKCQEDAAADFSGIFYRFEARCVRSPIVSSKIRVGCAGGHDEVVVGDLGAAAERDLAGLHVDAGYLIHQHLGVVVLAQDGADGLRNVGGRQHRQSDLVKQRLKCVVIAAVDEGDVDGAAFPIPGRHAGRRNRLQ